MVAQAAAHRLIARKPLREATMRSGRLSIAIAGRNDEFGRIDESTKQGHMTWVGRCYEVRGQAMSSTRRH